MAGIHDDSLTQIGPVQESRPSERLLAFQPCCDQQVCDVSDSSGIIRRNDLGDVFVFCGPRPYGSVQPALPAKPTLHEMPKAVRFTSLGVEFLNDLIGHTLLPAPQYLRPEIDNLSEVPVKTAARHLQLRRPRAHLQGVGALVR